MKIGKTFISGAIAILSGIAGFIFGWDAELNLTLITLGGGLIGIGDKIDKLNIMKK
jgi:hypothetical protein